MTTSTSPLTPLNIAVIGPAGFGGSWLTKELVSRGHYVTGLSRNPEKLGKHPLYIPKFLDITSSIPELAQAFAGFDVIVDEYGPHAAGFEALKYSVLLIPRFFLNMANCTSSVPFLEVTRRVVLAIKLARVPYFIKVGGTGSLYLPGRPYVSVLESPKWWIDYRRGIADSHAHVSYMEERLGPSGVALREYRNARLALKSGSASQANLDTISSYEESVKQKDTALEFVTACRTSFMFFEGSTDFRWTFVSPR
jgi:putative NADH-flavin reductase